MITLNQDQWDIIQAYEEKHRIDIGYAFDSSDFGDDDLIKLASYPWMAVAQDGQYFWFFTENEIKMTRCPITDYQLYKHYSSIMSHVIGNTIDIWHKLEAIKNRNGGMPPKK